MKSIFIAAGLLVALMYARPAFAGDQDFTLVNKTGYDIAEVYVSAAHDDDWGEDVMGKEMLEDGEKVDITFTSKEGACHWDLKVVYQDKDVAIWHDINLCKVSKVTLHWDKKSGATTAVTE